MSRIVISGASGDLGRRVTSMLIDAGRGSDLILVSRTPGSLRTLADTGATIRRGDHQDRDVLEHAYQGGDILFLISGLNLGRRVREHRNAIAAATMAGITHIVYTSVSGVQPGNPAVSAIDHHQSEQDLRRSGLRYTVLRNALYAEIVSNVLLAPALKTGAIVQATGAGYLAPVAKADVARSATACLLRPEDHAGATYEITGPELLNFEEIAAIGSRVHERAITYLPVTAQERLAMFDTAGIPRTYDPAMPPSPDGHFWASDELISAEVAVAAGYQAVLSHHVEQITGRKPERLADVMDRVRSLRYDKIGVASAP